MFIKVFLKKSLFTLRAIFEVRKAHEVPFSVWIVQRNTFFNNINSLYKVSRGILLQPAVNGRIFELVVVDKARKIMDSCWIIN
jgi:hypothetical protein